MRHVAAIEAAGPEQPLVEVLELVGIGLLDQAANLRIIRGPFIPSDPGIVGQRRLGDAGDDRDL